MRKSSLNTVMNAVPVVAAILGDKLGVKVQWGNFQTASTNGKVIYLPFTKLIPVLWGYLVHEAAHLRYTTFSTFEDQPPPIFRMLNYVEDIRIEGKIAIDYPGTRMHLLALNAHIIGLDKGNEHSLSSPLSVLYSAVYEWGYSKCCNYPGFKLVDTFSKFESVFGKAARIKLGALLSEIPTCADTDQAYLLTMRIFAMAKEELETQQKPKAANNNPQNQNQSKQDNDSSQSKNSGDQPANGKPSNQSNQSSTAEIAQWLSDVDLSSLPGDKGDDARKSMESSANSDLDLRSKCMSIQNQIQQSTDDLTNDKSSPEDFSRARGLSARLSAQLSSAIQASSAAGINHVRSGNRIDPRRAVRFVTEYDDKIFVKKTQPKLDVNTAIHLLVDYSSSMDENNKMAIASDSALALAMALKKIRGCNPAVSFFTSDKYNPIRYGLRHGEDIKSARKFPRLGANSTPTAEALNQAVYELAKVNAQRHILILLTDGAPSNFKAAYEKAREIERSGEIELIGIGICDSAITRFVTNSIVINDPQELLGKLFRVIQKRLAA